ncbi:hypothetical protein [Clostridium hydrogeniformans]|uniref:hypothetical protein n=1 Tax=Clostridium hydrogeniformans TaxID=349933 RepID=UPI0004853376|nr:hypothetical protein [Clostridium hydrogeniformans]
MNIGILIMTIFFGVSLIINIIRLVLPVVKYDSPLIYKTRKYLNSRIKALLYLSILIALGFIVVDSVLIKGIEEMNTMERFTYILLAGLIVGNCFVYVMLIMQKVFMFNDGILFNGIFIEWKNVISLKREEERLILVFDNKKASNVIPIAIENNLILPYENSTLNLIKDKISSEKYSSI